MNHKSSSGHRAETVERAFRHWQACCEADAARSRSTSAPPAFTVAVSREAGANGAAVARAVGAQLDWPVYDNEILQRIAGEMGLRTSLLADVDEKQVSWLKDCLQGFASKPTVSDSGYVRHLVEMLKSLAAHGNCVIVGRGAAVVLPPKTTLRVRLVSPIKARVAVIQERFGIPVEEAVRWVEKTDLERGRFVQDHFLKDPADPRHYDLVLNSARFSIADCAGLIVEALHKLQARVPDNELVCV